MKNAVLAILALAAVIVTVFIFGAADRGMFLDNPAPNKSVIRGSICALAMLAGIVSGTLHSRLSAVERPNVREVFSSIWRDGELWKSLLASPIVFGVVYALLAESHDVVMAIVFSFQNGFFCKTVLESKRANLAVQENQGH